MKVYVVEIVGPLDAVCVLAEVMHSPLALNDVHGLLLTVKPTVFEASWTQ